MAESEIRTNLTDNMNGVYDNKLMFEVHKDSTIEVVATADIERDVEACDAVAVTYLPQAAQFLKAVASDCSAVATTAALQRTGNIGCSTSGPSPQFAQMSELLYTLLENLAAETYLACDALTQWSHELNHHEESVISQIDALNCQLDAPTHFAPHDPRTVLPWEKLANTHFLEPDWRG